MPNTVLDLGYNTEQANKNSCPCVLILDCNNNNKLYLRIRGILVICE